MSITTLREITKNNSWHSVVKNFTQESILKLASGEDFGTYWIEGGHLMRQQIADDAILALFLRNILPKYTGETITLYRGENIERWRSGSIGLAWTARKEVAQMFGRGLNAMQDGGILLKGDFVPSAIISGPNSHSIYLREFQYTIDPLFVPILIELETYPQLYAI